MKKVNCCQLYAMRMTIGEGKSLRASLLCGNGSYLAKITTKISLVSRILVSRILAQESQKVNKKGPRMKVQARKKYPNTY